MQLIQPGVGLVEDSGKLSQTGVSVFEIITEQIDPSTIVLGYKDLFEFTYVNGKTLGSVADLLLSDVLVNNSSSNTIYKINTLMAVNTDFNYPADVTFDLFRDPARIYISRTMSLDACQTFILVGSDESIYLGQGESLRCFASVANTIHIICSYEEME
jgi:hypothetical protein